MLLWFSNWVADGNTKIQADSVLEWVGNIPLKYLFLCSRKHYFQKNQHLPWNTSAHIPQVLVYALLKDNVLGLW